MLVVRTLILFFNILSFQALAAETGFVLGVSKIGDKLGPDSVVSKKDCRGVLAQENLLLATPSNSPAPISQLPSPLQEFLTREAVIDAPKEAFDPKVSKLPATIATVINLALKDPAFSTRIKANLSENPTNRDYLVSAIQDADLRRVIYDAASLDINLDAQKVGIQERVEDIGILGAGIHETNMQNVWRDYPEIRTRTFEQSHVVASTFARGGTAFNINSSSKRENVDHLRQALGDGDLNFMPGGAIQLSFFDNERNPVALSLAQAATINRSFSKNPIEFGAKIESVQMDGDLVKKVTLEDGSTRSFTELVLTGLGDSNRPNLPGVREIVAQDKQSGVPRTFTFFEFKDLINGLDSPFEYFEGKRIAVIGAGDSGKADVRWLLQKANPASYGRNGRRFRGPKSVEWYGQECTDCASFVDRNRSFYFDIAGGFRAGNLIAKPKLDSIVSKSPTSELELTDAQGQQTTADIVIYTTGIQNDIAKILAPVFGYDANSADPDIVNDPTYFRTIEGFEPTLGVVSYAKEAIDQSGRGLGIYLVGPTSGRGVVSQAELRAIEENSVAMANHSWRAYRMAGSLARVILSRRKQSAYNQSEEPSTKLEIDQPGTASPVFQMELDLGRRIALRTGDDISLIATLTRLIGSQFGTPALKFKIVIAQRNDSTVDVQMQPAANPSQVQRLAEEFKRSRILKSILSRWMNGNSVISVDFEFDAHSRIASSGVEASVGEIQRPSQPSISKLKADQVGQLRNLVASNKGRYGGISDEIIGFEGQQEAAKFFNGEMTAVYDAAVVIFGKKYADETLKWRRVNLTSEQSENLRTFIARNKSRYGGISDEIVGFEGQQEAAKFFNGEMTAVYDAAVDIFGKKYADETLKWRRVNLTSEQSENLRTFIARNKSRYGGISDEIVGFEGQQEAAKSFNGEMTAVYDAAVDIFGKKYADETLKWRRVNLTSEQSEDLRTFIARNKSRYGGISDEIVGFEGQQEAAKFFNGEMTAVYDAAVDIFGKKYADETLKWRRVNLTSKQSENLRTFIARNKSRYGGISDEIVGFEGQQEAAKFFNGEMTAVYDAAVDIFGKKYADETLKWRRVNLTSKQSENLRTFIARNNGRYGGISDEIVGFDGQQMAAGFFSGDMAAAYNAAKAIYGTKFVDDVLRWKNFEP
jgi:dsDNA-binding SOS-regulon protein